VTVARARPLASRSRAKVSMSARRTANSPTERVRHQLASWRRSRRRPSWSDHGIPPGTRRRRPARHR
jgi:hypothetical protein